MSTYYPNNAKGSTNSYGSSGRSYNNYGSRGNSSNTQSYARSNYPSLGYSKPYQNNENSGYKCNYQR